MLYVNGIATSSQEVATSRTTDVFRGRLAPSQGPCVDN